MVAIEDRTRRLLALAPGDPMDVRTFSGLSRRLLTELAAQDVDVLPRATRLLRPSDVLTAPNWRGFARGQLRGRRAPRIDPDWYWSRAGYERFTQRVLRVASASEASAVLQVGTHVGAHRLGLPTYCITDATVTQAVAADSFSVSRGRSRTVAEAIEVQREVFHGCRVVLVLSEWAAASVRDDYGVPTERVVVVGAGTNVPPGATPVPAGDRDRRILFVGLDWEQKGGPLVLDALRIVRRRVPDAELTVVGCTPDVHEEGVRVVGRLDPRDPATPGTLADLYGRARAFTIAPAFDAFPNVLLEAAARGSVLVSTDRGSRGEVVRDGVTGLLAPHGDPGALADRLVAVLTDDDLATRLSTNARELVVTRMTWPVVAGRVLSALGWRTETSS